MLKIVLATHFPADVNRPNGGVEAVSVNLTRALANLDDTDVHVVTFAQDSAAEGSKNSCGATIHYLPRPIGSLLRISLTSGRDSVGDYIESLNPHIVHAHDTFGLMVTNLSLPRVFTVHGFIHEDILVSSSSFRLLRSKIWKRFETSAWCTHGGLISISPYVREKVYRHGVRRIYDIDNPISERNFEQGGKSEEARIFSAAVISRRKNTLNLIKAVERIRDAGSSPKLVLAGAETEPAYAQSVHNYVSDKNLQGTVEFLGQVSADSVYEEMRKASVFALVSREENSPMGIEEAMACGTPVVTTNKCGMPYMVDHGVSGLLVDSEDVQEISEAIMKIISSPEVVDSFGAAGREIAMRRFHPAVVANRTLMTYIEIIDRHRRTAEASSSIPESRLSG